jgi:chromosome segregation ATPase
MPANSNTARTEREIATIKADVAAMGHLFQKLDDAIDKIGDASANISSILAVHEERLESTEKVNLERRRETEAAVKELHSRISTSTRENLEQHNRMSDNLNKSEAKILEAINELRKDVNREQEHLESRINKLEQWKWILMGVLVGLSFLVPNMSKIVSMLAS